MSYSDVKLCELFLLLQMYKSFFNYVLSNFGLFREISFFPFLHVAIYKKKKE